MHGKYDRGLMARGEAARRCISNGEDPFTMLLQAVWPDHDWAESAMLARLESCPRCSGSKSGCPDCGSTGLVTEDRRKWVAAELLADQLFQAT